MFSQSLFEFPEIFPKIIILILAVFMWIEWLGRENRFAIEKLGFQWAKPFRIAFYYALVLLILLFSGKELQFIYFQF